MARQEFIVSIELAERFDGLTQDDLDDRYEGLDAFTPKIEWGAAHGTTITLRVLGDTTVEARDLAQGLVDLHANPNQVHRLTTSVTSLGEISP